MSAEGTQTQGPDDGPLAPSLRTLVIGESLMDIVRRHDDPDDGSRDTEHVGGSPANVALGLARLGHVVDFATTFGADERGAQIGSHLLTGGVQVVPESVTPQPTSTALARLDAERAATYDFILYWHLPHVEIRPGTGHLHTGSIGTTLAPGAAEVTDALHRGRDRATISYDPNVRPTIMGGVEEVRPRVEELVGLSDVVKCSSDDLDWLYPGTPVAEIHRRWRALGAACTVITLGGDGVSFAAADGVEVRRPALTDRVVDTVGAGDSFMAGLISGLLDDGLLGGLEARQRLREATSADVAPAVDRALQTSGITVTHDGAYAPTRDELRPAN